MVCHHSVEQREKFKGKEQLASHAREYVAKWKVGVGGGGEPKKGGEEPKKGRPKKDQKDKRQSSALHPGAATGLAACALTGIVEGEVNVGVSQDWNDPWAREDTHTHNLVRIFFGDRQRSTTRF